MKNFQEEINGVFEELLEEDEMNITNLNNLIYAAATIMTQTLNEPGKEPKIEEILSSGKYECRNR